MNDIRQHQDWLAAQQQWQDEARDVLRQQTEQFDPHVVIKELAKAKWLCPGPQEPKVWNKRDPNCPKDAVYVGRPGIWSNPYHIGPDGNRAEVIVRYKEWLGIMMSTGKRDPSYLRGKDLSCWCAPKPCHADILLEVANA